VTPPNNLSIKATTYLMKARLLKTTGLALLLAALPALASAKSEKSPEQTFVKKAAQGGMTEVQLGDLASKQGSTSAVKDFGAMMVTDHTKLNEGLKSAAEKKGYKVPAKLNPEHQALVDKFSKLSGAEFDKAYIAEMVKDHEADYAAFQNADQTLTDPDLKAAVESALPVIKSHLDHVKEIKASEK